MYNTDYFSPKMSDVCLTLDLIQNFVHYRCHPSIVLWLEINHSLSLSVCLCDKIKIHKREHKRSWAVWKFQNMIHVHVLALKALILKPLNAHKCTIFTQGRINLMFLAG